MNLLNTDFLEENYLTTIKQRKISGRYITLNDIEPLYDDLDTAIASKKIGESEQGKAIYQLKLGSGKIKILIWSQMHGNESTGTKAVFDFLKYIKAYKNTEIVNSILNNCDITIIPMLNPDGAEVYTRVNANDVDLNRDAVALEAKESKLLRKILDTVKPQFCFNLHDQRTIFGVEGTKNPATISFLAPSEEITRKLTKGREQTMNVIVAMNALLQKLIPNHIGRYSDEFYPTATGDNFQKLGHNTILIEAGHYPDDYERETVRKYNFYALLQGIYHVATEKNFTSHLDYFSIPNNIKNFYDVIYRSEKNKKDVAFQYVEKVENGKFVLSLMKEKEGDLSSNIAHKEELL
ncbi:M14 family zinc carboxypeptidase [Tenacibaculum finnmarkense]|uniref:M14 family zinc carboxypeptidase n=1 Tax=Tenacibaculum finnmarkense TaxID=2781243 RepID=UPI000C6958A5|nr:M14 family zinc carboxypeptidase [Tenacibaculum finnmarkense]MCD8403248.1 zinc carboxypeptidase [Tenacibaculum finnmarkense genomovar finnmarkense]MCD8438881.1 zinc carboxypeptidase [Tenacibaculum finnmarkense genomovar ulcerans]MCG8719846.1 zinc carboxypeptidase [Tenacibaculum finnmarkense]SOS55428.1 Zinc carboxypeptidase [Tenacibaculum finnmarkense]